MATIVMNSQQVIDAAMKTIAHIEDVRASRDEGVIESRMQTKAGWFKRYYPTYDQAVILLDQDRHNFWGWRSCYGWGDLDKAKALLKLAQHGDPVTLNEEDVRVLF